MSEHKDNVWFPHQVTLSENPEVMNLIMEHGWAAYGVLMKFWETLRKSPGYRFPESGLNAFAWQCHLSEHEKKTLFAITQSSMFRRNDGLISCPQFDALMFPLDEKRRIQSEGGKQGRQKQVQSKSGVTPEVPRTNPGQEENRIEEKITEEERTEQDRTEEKKKEEDNTADAEVIVWPSFDDFWNAYDKKEDRIKCEKKWQKISQADREKIMEHVPVYVASTPDKQFRKHPATYLNNNSWENEIVVSGGGAAGSLAVDFMDRHFGPQQKHTAGNINAVKNYYRLNETQREIERALEHAQKTPVTSDSFESGRNAFDEFMSDAVYIDKLLNAIHSGGYQTCTKKTLSAAIRSFLQREETKDGFKQRTKSHVRNHLSNWIISNISSIHEYATIA